MRFEDISTFEQFAEQLEEKKRQSAIETEQEIKEMVRQEEEQKKKAAAREAGINSTQERRRATQRQLVSLIKKELADSVIILIQQGITPNTALRLGPPRTRDIPTTGWLSQLVSPKTEMKRPVTLRGWALNEHEWQGGKVWDEFHKTTFETQGSYVYSSPMAIGDYLGEDGGLYTFKGSTTKDKFDRMQEFPDDRIFPMYAGGLGLAAINNDGSFRPELLDGWRQFQLGLRSGHIPPLPDLNAIASRY